MMRPFHDEGGRRGFVIGLRELLVDGEVIQHSSETGGTVKHVAFVSRLLN